MKIGDTVKITDGSYTESIVNGKLEHEFLNHGEAKERHYVVIAVDCTFPLQEGYFSQPIEYHNNTVIQDEYGKVVFVHYRFLQVVKPKHEWEHGDVFKTGCVGSFSIMMYLHPEKQHGKRTPYVVYVDKDTHPYSVIEMYLKDAKFLFNIKEKI